MLKGKKEQEKRRENSAQNKKDENRAGKGQRKACLIGEKLKKGRKNEHKPPSKKRKRILFGLSYYLLLNYPLSCGKKNRIVIKLFRLYVGVCLFGMPERKIT